MSCHPDFFSVLSKYEKIIIMENIENILKNIDGDWLTGILESYAEELHDEIILLDITKKDLSNKTMIIFNRLVIGLHMGMRVKSKG